MHERKLILGSRFIFGLVFCLFAVKSLIILFQFNFKVSDNDQAQFCLACHDFANLHFFTPFIYGCSYGNMLESFLATPFYLVGLPLYFALPLSNCFWFLVLVYFLAQGFNKLYQDKLWGILFIFALSFINSEYFCVLFAPKGHLAGIFPALLACILIIYYQNKTSYALAGLLIGLALQFNPNAVFIVLMACLIINKLHFIPFIVLGFILSLIYQLILNQWLPIIDTGYLHPQWAIEFHWSDFLKTIQHVDQYFNSVTPFFTKMGSISLVLPLILSWILIKKRQFIQALVCVLISLFLLATLGINKIFDGSTDILFPYFRFYLALAILNAFIFSYLSQLILDKMKSEIINKAVFVIPILMIIPLILSFNEANASAVNCGNTYSVKKSYNSDLKANCQIILKNCKKVNHKKLMVTGDYPLYSELILIKTMEIESLEVFFHHRMFYWINTSYEKRSSSDLLVFIQFEGLLMSEKIKALGNNRLNSAIPAFYFDQKNKPYISAKEILQ